MLSGRRQLAAIMFTDLVGYTALMQQNEQLAFQKRERSRKILEKCLVKYDGKLVQYYGDGALSIFRSAVNAVSCGIEIQTLNLSEPAIDMRIGIHATRTERYSNRDRDFRDLAVSTDVIYGL